MDIKILFSYTESVIPPRCRNERRQSFDDGEVTLTISGVRAQDAPVAIVQHGWKKSYDTRDIADFPIEYRFFNGTLWSRCELYQCEPRGHTSRGTDWDVVRPTPEIDMRRGTQADNYALRLPEVHYKSRQEAIEALQGWASQYLLIDGQAWMATGEPRYVAMTMGLGHNHGGTSLSVHASFNTNINDEHFFNLLQIDDAIRYTEQLATERGDTKSLPITPEYAFTVHVPAAINIPFNRVLAQSHGDHSGETSAPAPALYGQLFDVTIKSRLRGVQSRSTVFASCKKAAIQEAKNAMMSYINGFLSAGESPVYLEPDYLDGAEIEADEHVAPAVMKFSWDRLVDKT